MERIGGEGRAQGEVAQEKMIYWNKRNHNNDKTDKAVKREKGHKVMKAKVKKVGKKEVKGKSEVTPKGVKEGRDATEGIVKQLEEEIESVKGMREFVNNGANALAARLLGGQNLYTDKMVELLRERLTGAWAHSRVLGEYLEELESVKGMMSRTLEAMKPIEPEVVE